MLGDAEIHASVAVKDMDKGKAFYRDTLGLQVAMDSPQGVSFKAGNTYIEVYQSEFAGSAKNTVAMFVVKDLDNVMSGLRGKGVEFMDYDMPGLKTENGVAQMGDDARGSWFQDPDGNTIGIVEGSM